jgi:hypothetical protein
MIKSEYPLALHRGADMYTTILAYVIAFLGLVMIGSGVWGLFYLQSGARPIPLRYYAIVIGMICAGFGLGGIAQGLRVLVGIAHTIQPH